MLLSSGYIAGGAIAGILIALLALTPDLASRLDLTKSLPPGWEDSPAPSLVAFGVLVAVLLGCGLGVLFKGDGAGTVAAAKEIQGREEDL